MFEQAFEIGGNDYLGRIAQGLFFFFFCDIIKLEDGFKDKQAAIKNQGGVFMKKDKWKQCLGLCATFIALAVGVSGRAYAYVGVETVSDGDLEWEKNETFEEADDFLLMEEDISEYILQEGTMETRVPYLKTDVPGARWFASSADEESAKQAIYEGLKDFAGSIDVSGYNIPIEDLKGIYISVLNSHADLFYVQSFWSYYKSLDGTKISSILPKYKSEFTQADIQTFYAKGNEIIAAIDRNWSDEEKVLFIHDYLVSHCEYDKTYSRYSAYDALVTESAVCQGYALAFEYLMQSQGIECDVITSDTIGHAWNMVRLNGRYYYVDCTFDDPSNNWYHEYCAHNQLLLDQETCKSRDHDAQDWISSNRQIYVYDNFETGSGYINYFWNDVCTAIPEIGRKCAYVKSDDKFYIYDYATGMTQSFNYTKSNWAVWGNSGYYYTKNFASVIACNGTFYYSTTTAVYSMTLDGVNDKIYTLSDSEKTLGYIYGIRNVDGNIEYDLNTVPYGSQKTGGGQIQLSIPLQIIEEPQNVSVEVGKKATFHVEAVGSNLTYQWQYSLDKGKTWKNNTVAGCRTDTMLMEATKKRNGYRYRCIITDNKGNSVISNAVTLTVQEAIQITKQPTDQKVKEGTNAIFSVTAVGTNLSYQWQYSTNNGKTWKNNTVTGCQTDTMLMEATQNRNGYQYRCVITDGTGKVLTSNVVNLTLSNS